MIHHASDPELSPLPLPVPVGLPPLRRFTVLPPRRTRRPPTPARTAPLAAVRVPPVAAPVDVEVLPTEPATDDIEIQSSSAGRKTGPRGPLQAMMVLLGNAQATVGGLGMSQALPCAQAASQLPAFPIAISTFWRTPAPLSLL